MALISYPDIDELPERSRKIVDVYPNNLVLMLSGLGDAFPALMETIGVYVKRQIISPALREMVTLRIANLFNAEYVLKQHIKIAQELGISEEKLISLAKSLPNEELTDDENIILIFIDSLTNRELVKPELTKKIISCIGEKGLQELMLIFAINIFLTKYSSVLEVELDDHINKV